VGVRIVADAGIEDRVEELARADVDIIHLHLPVYPDTGSRPSYEAWPPAPPGRVFDTLADAVPRAHNRLIEVNLRDQVSLVVSGDITYAERVPKAIVLGADAVAVDVPLLVALECTVCGECQRQPSCPRNVHTIDPVWGTQRIVNMMASWHNQLLEILGAMGLREVSRLRGEIGRAMKKDDLDREIFATIFAPPEAAPSLAAAGTPVATDPPAAAGLDTTAAPASAGGGESEGRTPYETGGKRR
jgi:hypothetical protein